MSNRFSPLDMNPREFGAYSRVTRLRDNDTGAIILSPTQFEELSGDIVHLMEIGAIRQIGLRWYVAPGFGEWAA